MNRKIEVPSTCTHIKIDIGLSYTAPISNKWLVKEPEVFVLGFEPNPHCCNTIMTSTFSPTSFPDFNLEKKSNLFCSFKSKTNIFLDIDTYGNFLLEYVPNGLHRISNLFLN